jgi:hypothetical protein
VRFHSAEERRDEEYEKAENMAKSGIEELMERWELLSQTDLHQSSAPKGVSQLR